MSEFYKQPLILDDQPAKYEDFSGGINNDRNNENVKRNQLREALNTHYDNGDLTKRLGAEVFRNLIYNDSDPDRHRNIVQGVFTFVGQYGHYLIVQRDGFIYYSTLGETDTLNMIEIPIIVNDAKYKYDPTNLTIGLEKYTVNPGENKWEVIPDLLLDNDGYLLQEAIITGEDDDKVDDKFLSGIYIPATTRLILQNYRTVQAAVFNDTLYMATGTRFLKLYETIDGTEITLTAEIVAPYHPNGFDVQNIGYNYLSPFPEVYMKDTYQLATSRINNIICETHTIFTVQQNSVEFKAVMDYIEGTTQEDYYFKWEYKITEADYEEGVDPEPEWVVAYDWSAPNPDYATYKPRFVGLNEGDRVDIRCSYTNKFKTHVVSGMETFVLEDIPGANGAYETYQEVLDIASPTLDDLYLVTNDLLPERNGYWKWDGLAWIKQVQNYVVDKIFGEFGQFSQSYVVEGGSKADYEPAPESFFLEIHSCNRLFTDGNVIILYGNTYRTGNWFKTIITNFEYIAARNSLNFQTNKNERIVACLPMEGNIIVFADNEHLGGSIHKVYGNGDDYDAGDGYFSPFKKKIVNTKVSCDHPNSVQFVENYIVFKYRQQVYLIDSRELNADRLNVMAISDNITHRNSEIFLPEIPFEPQFEFKLYSEVTEDYYALIFPEYNLRWKMYYKMAQQYQGQNKVYFPWLRDTSEYLKIDYILNINGVSTHVTDKYLLQYTNVNYLDLETPYIHHIKTKAFDMYNPALVKFVNSLVVYYYRGSTDTLVVDIDVYNEGEYRLIGKEYESFYDPATNRIIWGDQDAYFGNNLDESKLKALTLDKTDLNNTKLGKHLYTSEVINPDLKFPCLSAYVEIKTDSAEAFSLASLTFDYVTTDMPSKSLPKIYSEIIRKNNN